MRRTTILAMALSAGLAVEWLLVQIEAGSSTASEYAVPDKARTAGTLAQLCAGELEIVDLTWPLNAQGAYWPGDNYKPFELRTIATLERDGVLSKSFCMPEHQGTHIDAPNHFVGGQLSVDALKVEDLFAPGVVIDIAARVAKDDDYRLTTEDVAAWEHQHGPIPQRAVVLLATGWGRHFTNRPRATATRTRRAGCTFPDSRPRRSSFYSRSGKIRGIGIDTLSIDHGLSRDFAVHRLLGGAGRYGLENLAHLDQLPPRDFFLIIAPIKIETGSGGPTRVFAVESGRAEVGRRNAE